MNDQDIKLHPFAAALLKHLKGKEIEINSGDIKTINKFAEQDINHKNVIRGLLEDACGDALLLAVKRDGKYGRVFINVWSVKSVVPIEDDLFVKDIYDDEHDGFAKYRRR
jgi:hypothetical protein